MSHWKIGDCIVPDKRAQDSLIILLKKQGHEAQKLSEDHRKTCFDMEFNSSQIMAGAFADEYFLDLNFTMSTDLQGKSGFFEATNEYGMMNCPFKFELNFKPEFTKEAVFKKIDPTSDMFSPYKLSQGKIVQVFLKANPKPSSGEWTLGNDTIPIGTGYTSDVGNKFLTTEITETDLNHEYLATLYYNFTPNVAEGTLKIINDIGSSKLFFKIPASIQATNVWSILLLVIGVFIGIFITICIYSVCSGQWCKRKEKPKDLEMDQMTKPHSNSGVSPTTPITNPQQERLKIPHSKVVDAQNNLGQPTELNFLPEKILSNEIPKLHNHKVAENKNILDHPTKQKLSSDPVKNIPENQPSLDDADNSMKEVNPFSSDLSPTSCREMQKIPLPQVIGGTNNTSLPTQLKILPEKMFLQQPTNKEDMLSLDEPKSFTIPRPNIIGGKKDLGHQIEKNLIPRSEMRSPKVSSKDKGTWPNLLDQMMDLYRNTLCPLMQMIDDNENAPLFRRKKVHKLLQTFFIKCQTLGSSEKVGELDSRTKVILDHPCELKKFSVDLADLMSRTTKNVFDVSNGQEKKMLESFFKMCDEKKAPEKLEEVCLSILKRLNLESEDETPSRDHSRSPTSRKQKNKKAKYSTDSRQRLLEEE
jgi:hypothetical protein